MQLNPLSQSAVATGALVERAFITGKSSQQESSYKYDTTSASVVHCCCTRIGRNNSHSLSDHLLQEGYHGSDPIVVLTFPLHRLQFVQVNLQAVYGGKNGESL